MLLRAGIGKADITPPVGVELCGYGPFLERKSTGVHDRLFCKALLLESASERGLLLACDLVSFKDSIVKAIRKAIFERFRIAPEKVVIATIHTHSGPGTGGYVGWGEPDDGYIGRLPQMMLPAVEEAVHSLKKVSVGIGHVPFDGTKMSVNRVRPDSGVNMRIGLIKFEERAGGKPLAFIVNFGAHAVVQGPDNLLISRDWPGAAVDAIGSALGAETIFLQGACGDINSNPFVMPDPSEGFRQMERIGILFAETAAHGLRHLSVKEPESFAVRQIAVELPLDPIPKEELEAVCREQKAILENKKDLKPEDRKWAQFHLAGAAAQLALYKTNEVNTKRIEVQYTMLDKGIIITIPAELYSEFGAALEKGLPDKDVFVSTSGSIGYIPSQYDFENKMYASSLVPRVCGNMPFRKDVGRVLVENILEYLRT